MKMGMRQKNNIASIRFIRLLLLSLLALPIQASNIPEALATWIAGAASDGQATQAAFAIGVTADAGQRFGTAFESWQTLDILSDIRIAPEHIGKSASLYLVALFNNSWYMKNSQGQWGIWDLNINSLVPAGINQSLEALTGVTVQKQLSNLPGNFSVWVGYKVDGVIYYSAQPFSFTVIAKEKPATTCTGECISNLFIPGNSYKGPVPADAGILSGDEFAQGVKEGALTLVSAKNTEESGRLREAGYQENLAVLKSLKPSPAISSLLEAAGKTTDPFFEPASVLKEGRQVQLLSLNALVKEAVSIEKLAQSPENAFNNYQQSYNLLPDNLKNGLPALASLQGKSVEEINAAIALLDNALAADIAALENSSVANDTLLPKILAGNGSDNDNDSFCKPKELYGKFNWPLKNFLTPVKDQGQRGMCWAFTTVAALESRELVQRNSVHDLSEQFLVNRVKLAWDKDDYEDGYICTRALDDMLKHNQVLPEESFWTYNRSLGRNVNASSDVARYQNSCLNYMGSCGNTAHQTGTVFTTPLPGLTFAAYEDTNYRGAGVAAGKPIVIWKSGDRFKLNFYRLKLSQGHTIMAGLGTREGFMKPIRGFVTDSRDIYFDDKGIEKSGFRGGHAVLIVGFINNETIKSYPGGYPGGIPDKLPDSGGFFVIKNSWGCGFNGYGDGGYAYIPAEYIERYFWDLSIVEMDATRSAKWQDYNGEGKLTIKWGDQLNTDLRISKKLFEVYPPRNKKIDDVNIQVSSSVAGDQITLISTFGNTAGYAGYFSTIGLRTVQATARLGNETVPVKIQVNVVNTAPTIELLPPSIIHQGEIIKLTVALKDINETNPGSMCSRVTWNFTAPDFPYSGDGSCSLTVAFGETADRSTTQRSFTVSTTDSEGLRTNQSFTVTVYPPLENPYPRISDAWLHEPDRLIGHDADAVCQTGVRIPIGTTIDLTKPESSYTCLGSTPEPTVIRPYEASVSVENPDNVTLKYDWYFWEGSPEYQNILDKKSDSIYSSTENTTYIIPYYALGVGRTPFNCGVDVEIWTPVINGYGRNTVVRQNVWAGQCIFYDIAPH